MSRMLPVLVFGAALAFGAIGAQGCHMHIRHVEQHRQADEDHKILQQLTPAVQQLIAIEQQRQQRR